jgi:hypothetical protein
VNDCADTGCDNTFSTLETKLQTLLKGRYHFDFDAVLEKLFPPLANRLSSSREDGVGGTPQVDITSTSDNIRSVLELDLILLWVSS